MGKETDLPEEIFPHPYLSTQVNRVTGEPRILGTADKNEPVYNEAPLVAQPNPPEEDDHTVYPFGENAYLDPEFLQALGSLEDRGLAAEALHLVQLDGKLQHLDHWEKGLKAQEQEVTKEKGELIQRQQTAFKKRKEVYKQLRQVRATSRLYLQLPDKPSQLMMRFEDQFNPLHPLDRQRQGACFWCGIRCYERTSCIMQQLFPGKLPLELQCVESTLSTESRLSTLRQS